MRRFRAHSGLAVGLALALLSGPTVAGAAPTQEIGSDGGASISYALADLVGGEAHFGFSRVLTQGAPLSTAAGTSVPANTPNPASGTGNGLSAGINQPTSIIPSPTNPSGTTITGTAVVGTGGGGELFGIQATGPATTAPLTIPRIFFSTTIGTESFLCTAVPATAPFTTTCSGTTVGTILQNSTVSILFITTPTGAQVAVNGTAVGPGPGVVPPPPPIVGNPIVAIPQVGIPAVPRPPVQFIPSPPPPLLPPGGAIPSLQGAAPPAYPAVPVIPEADSALLLGVGLAALGAFAALRKRFGRRDDA